jgi:hypothetical protein
MMGLLLGEEMGTEYIVIGSTILSTVSILFFTRSVHQYTGSVLTYQVLTYQLPALPKLSVFALILD